MVKRKKNESDEDYKKRGIEYREKHKEYMKQYQKNWYAKHIEEHRKEHRDYYGRTKNIIHAKRLNKKLEVYKRLTDGDIKCQSLTCAVPGGMKDIRALIIDHIYGGGTKEKENDTRSYYDMLLSLPIEELKSKYQLLCSNCNWIKRFENKEFDHN